MLQNLERNFEIYADIKSFMEYMEVAEHEQFCIISCLMLIKAKTGGYSKGQLIAEIAQLWDAEEDLFKYLGMK